MDKIELEESIKQDARDLRLMIKAVGYGSFSMVLITLIVSIFRGI